MKRKANRRKRKKMVRVFLLTMLISGMSALSLILLAKGIIGNREQKSPEQVLQRTLLAYMDCISEKRYGDMYGMLTKGSVKTISEKDFATRNSAIYEGIEMENMIIDITAYDEENLTVKYNTSFDTVAGNVSFENEASFLEEDDAYKLVWNDSIIFPELGASDKVRVTTTQAKRGEILDRNGRILAGKGIASSVGIIPGKLINKEKAIKKIAKLLGIKPEDIEKLLSAKWVKDDSFVPIKTLRKIRDIELLVIDPDKEVLREHERQEKLLNITGVTISDTEVRQYPLKEAAAHLVGYVQNVTAEDLEEHAGEGYTSNSVIGKTGMEGLFEKELKGENGCKIYITDSEGREKEELACITV